MLSKVQKALFSIPYPVSLSFGEDVAGAEEFRDVEHLLAVFAGEARDSYCAVSIALSREERPRPSPLSPRHRHATGLTGLSSSNAVITDLWKKHSSGGSTMEQIITRLLQDFEQGKMTRRQLIQSLTVAATAASAVGTAPAASAAGMTLKVVNINHISYEVADYRKIRDFYVDLFGMKVSNDDGKGCRLSYGGSTSLFVRTARGNPPGPTPRVDHIAYGIENWNRDAMDAELKRRGLNPKSDAINVDRHFKDPEGFDVQVNDPRAQGG